MLTLLSTSTRSAPTTFTTPARLVRSASSMPNMRNASRMDTKVNTRRNLRRFRFAQTIGSQRNMPSPSDAPQRVDDLETHRRERRPRAGDQAEHHHQRDAGDERSGVESEHREIVLYGLTHCAGK